MRKPRVFLSYRRDDASHQVGRIYDYLERVFGRASVFKDVDSIPAGSDFRKVLEEAVAGCDVLLVVVGDHWLTVADKQGRRRLDNSGDFVRIEVEAALSRGVPVLPVLVGRASMPPVESLPDGMRQLAFRNAAQIRPDPDFRSDIKKLVAGVQGAAKFGAWEFERIRVGRFRARLLAAACAMIAVLCAGVALAMMVARVPPAVSDHTQEQMFELDPVELPKIGPDQRLRMRFTINVSHMETRQRTVFTAVEEKGVQQSVPRTENYAVTVYEKQTEEVELPFDCKIRVYKPTATDTPYLVIVSTGEPQSQAAYTSFSRPVFQVVDGAVSQLRHLRRFLAPLFA